MKKTLIVGILLTTLLLGGCASQSKKEDPLTSENMKYSTMSDEDTQKKVSDFLSKNNIDKKDISMFMQSVKHYYKSVEGVELLNENERLSKMQVPYNLYDLSDKWIENNPNFTDQNCRITAFRLFNKFIISNSSLDYDKIDNTNLEMDYATLRDNPDAKFSKEDMNKFFNFFSNIKVSDFNDVKKSADEIAKELKNRKISFIKNKNVSMINVFLHDPEDEILFVGHSGISVKTKDGLLFIEKYGFSLPYQVSKFKDKAELKEYLMDRLDVDTSGNGAAKPIIMENDELMN